MEKSPVTHLSGEDALEEVLSQKSKVLALVRGLDAGIFAGASGSVGVELTKSFWAAATRPRGLNWEIVTPPEVAGTLPATVLDAIHALGELAGQLSVLDATFQLGSVYSELMQPERRAGLGAFYTPPACVRHLLDMAESQGVDWRAVVALDPACGSGVFPVEAALRMRAACTDVPATAFLKHLETHLVGVEVDPVSGWMAQVLLEVAMLPVCEEANERLPLLVRQASALELDTAKQYDLVMGNPPYGKVRLYAELRQRFARSLFGHANLYGMFLDLGASLLAPNGLLAYVVPTSFLGGQYFKALRATLSAECPLSAAGFIDTRDTVFADVLQETMLAVFCKQEPADDAVDIHTCVPTSNAEMASKEVGRVEIEQGEAPWILPRRQEELALTSVLARMSGRLADYGFRVNTGQLVWNRHKPQLLTEQPSNGYPIVWAESVRPEGFKLSASKRNHAPWLQLLDGQDHLLTDRECLLLQRTTAKEQSRRLIASVLPKTVLDQYGAVVVENHLNILMPEPEAPVSLYVLAHLLANPVVDRAYRCISGSVAVSAYELESLPLPTLTQMLRLQAAFAEHQSSTCLHQEISALYGE